MIDNQCLVVKWGVEIKKMKFKKTIVLQLCLFTSLLGVGQNDFSIRWIAHSTGETVEENPFNGSIAIKNEGETTILANDTLWYGYWIDGLPFDLGFNPDLVSGRVFESDFMPGDELLIANNFAWPPFGSGETIEICAAVYGIGITSFEEEYFLGDDSTENNTDCLLAVMPIYELSIEDQLTTDSPLFNCYLNAQELIIFQNSTSCSYQATLFISSLGGEVVDKRQLNLFQGQNRYSLPSLAQGIYVLSICIEQEIYTFKIFI